MSATIVELVADGRLIRCARGDHGRRGGRKSALVRDTCGGSGEGFGWCSTLARLPTRTYRLRRLAELLGYDRKLNTLDHPAAPRGYRILGRIPRLPKMVVQSIMSEFNGLDEILAAADPELESVEGVGDMRAKDIREGLRRLQEINLVDRYLQT